MTAYLEPADYLLIAERVLGLPAEVIANFNRVVGLSSDRSSTAMNSASDWTDASHRCLMNILIRFRGQWRTAILQSRRALVILRNDQ